MRNWAVDEKHFSKYPEKYVVWKLEQLINFGLAGEKINESQLRHYLPQLTLDPKKKKYLEFLLS